MVIYFGDLHCQEQEPFKSSALSILKYLYDNYQDATIIQGGDLFDSSSINHALVDDVLKILVKFKDFRIVTGNHDYSKRMNSILKPFDNYNNITVYDDVAEVDIEGMKLIMLPHKYGDIKSEYEKITGSYDYSISHITPIQEAFGDDGIELKFNVSVAHIFAHIHRHREFLDSFENKVLISGSTMTTRYGEQSWEKNIYELTKTEYHKIALPQYFTYETVEYGQYPEFETSICNIKNAPSVQSVFEMYRKYYIRESGIEINLGDTNNQTVVFEQDNIKKGFIKFCEDNNVADDVKFSCLSYL